MIPTLRTLTRKSKLGVGNKRDLTVQRILDLRRPIELVRAYYGLSNINFMDDILDELHITEEYRIPKPSTDIGMLQRFLKESYYYNKASRGEGSDKMRRESRANTKGQNQRRNQGWK